MANLVPPRTTPLSARGCLGITASRPNHNMMLLGIAQYVCGLLIGCRIRLTYAPALVHCVLAQLSNLPQYHDADPNHYRGACARISDGSVTPQHTMPVAPHILPSSIPCSLLLLHYFALRTQPHFHAPACVLFSWVRPGPFSFSLSALRSQNSFHFESPRSHFLLHPLIDVLCVY